MVQACVQGTCKGVLEALPWAETDGWHTCIYTQQLGIRHNMAPRQSTSSAQQYHGGYLVGHGVGNDTGERYLAQQIEPRCSTDACQPAD